MSKFKKAISFLAAALLIGSMATPMSAFASTPDEPPRRPPILRWANTTTAQASISASGKTVKPSVAVTATNNNIKISGTLYLEKKSGSSWVKVTSWSVSGTGTLRTSKSYTGTTGTTYRSRFSVTVGSERIEGTSSSCKV